MCIDELTVRAVAESNWEHGFSMGIVLTMFIILILRI